MYELRCFFGAVNQSIRVRINIFERAREQRAREPATLLASAAHLPSESSRVPTPDRHKAVDKRTGNRDNCTYFSMSNLVGTFANAAAQGCPSFRYPGAIMTGQNINRSVKRKAGGAAAQIQRKRSKPEIRRTCVGPGRVVEDRSDGIAVVSCNWGARVYAPQPLS